MPNLLGSCELCDSTVVPLNLSFKLWFQSQSVEFIVICPWPVFALSLRPVPSTANRILGPVVGRIDTSVKVRDFFILGRKSVFDRPSTWTVQLCCFVTIIDPV